MDGITFDINHQTVYAFGRCEQWIRDFAETHNIAFDVLAQRVATLLHSTAGGEVRGIENSVSSLRRESTEGSETPREVEVVKRPHRKTQVKAHAKEYVCAKCMDMPFRSLSEKQKHYYYVHGPGMTSPKAKPHKKDALNFTGIMKLKRAKPKVRTVVECKVCHKTFSNTQMGNHMRWTHKGTTEEPLPTVVVDAMSQYRDAVSSEPVNGVAAEL